MIVKPSETDGWICSSVINGYVHYFNKNRSCVAKEEASKVSLTRLRHWFHKESGIIIEEAFHQYLSIKEVDKYQNLIQDYPLPNKSGFFTVYHVPNIQVITCDFCGARPELRIDSSTGLYYCTCPSSFIPYDAEIGEEHPIGTMEECKGDLKPTILDAIKRWNEKGTYKKEVDKLIYVYKKNNTLDNFIKKFESKYAFVWERRPDRVMYYLKRADVILRMLGLDLGVLNLYRDDRFVREGELLDESLQLLKDFNSQLSLHLFRWIECLSKKKETH